MTAQSTRPSSLRDVAIESVMYGANWWRELAVSCVLALRCEQLDETQEMGALLVV